MLTFNVEVNGPPRIPSRENRLHCPVAIRIRLPDPSQEALIVCRDSVQHGGGSSRVRARVCVLSGRGSCRGGRSRRRVAGRGSSGEHSAAHGHGHIGRSSAVHSTVSTWAAPGSAAEGSTSQ